MRKVGYIFNTQICVNGPRFAGCENGMVICMKSLDVVGQNEENEQVLEKQYRSISDLAKQEETTTVEKAKRARVRKQVLPESGVNITKPQKRKVHRKKASRNGVFSIGGLLILVVTVFLMITAAAAVVYYVWDQSFEEVNLAKQTSLVLSGYNGKGSAELTLEAYSDKMDFFEQVEASLDHDSLLSNGDEITVSYSFDPELAKTMKLRVDGTSATIKVEGLVEPTRVTKDEIFQRVRLVTGDISPMITAELVEDETDDFLQNFEYELLEPKAFYEDGDVITVRASVDADLAFEHAYEFEEEQYVFEKEYVIASKEAYVTDASIITDEMIRKMFQDGTRFFDAAHAKEYGLRIFSEAHLKPQWGNKQTFFSWVNPRIISAYFSVVTEEGKELRETHVNDVKLIYEATLTQPDGTACNAEVVVQYTDLKMLEDGNIDLVLDSGKVIAASYRNSNIKNLVSDQNTEEYSTTKLEFKW